MPLPQIGLPVAAALHGCVLLSPPGDGEASHRILHQTQVGSMGSGTNEQDMGDSESQSVLKKRSLSWSQEPFTVLTVRVRYWYAMDTPPMGNNCIAVVPADGKAGRIPLPTPIRTLAARRFCTPTKNAAACVASPAPSGSLAPLSPVGSKKRSSASSLTNYLARPGSRRSHFHDPGIG